MSSVPIQLGLIGCGLNMGESHVPRLLAMPQVRVVGLCDPDPERVIHLCQQHPQLRGVPVFADYRELLDKLRLDGVVIATPHAYHFAQISDALGRGLHVLAEKPLVMKSDQARELIRLRDKQQRILVVAYQRHYQSEYRYLHKIVREGKLGRVNLIVGSQSESWLATNRNRWRTDPAISGGGVVADVMSHALENVLWTTDLQPTEVTAHFENCGTRVEVIAALCIQFVGGAIAALTMNGATPRSSYAEELSLWGDAGSVRLIWEDGASVTEWLPEKRSVPEEEWPPGSDSDTNFVNAVLGLEQVDARAEWALKVTLLKEALWEAGRSGRTVRVADS